MESRLLAFPAAECRSLALRGGSWARERSCSNTGTVNGQYKKNLKELLSNLSKPAPKNGVFRTSTVGTGVDQIHGSLMCFVDHDQAECLDCFANTTAWIARTCPNSRTASTSYGACLLRYSSPLPFFDTPKNTDGPDMNITFMAFSPPSNGDTASMANARSWLLEEISHKANHQTLEWYNQSRQYTADKQVITVYGLAQCREDLAPGGCSRCISAYNGLLRRLFPNNREGIVKGYSCYVRFQPSKISIFAEPMQPLSARTDPFLVLPPSYSHPAGQDSPLIAMFMFMVMAVVLITLSMMAALWWCWRKVMAWFCPTWTPFPHRRSFSVQAPVLNVELMPISSGNLETGAVLEVLVQNDMPIPIGILDTGAKEFSREELETASKNFSVILGTGGFGSVYWGKLGELEVAIKRLSSGSRQGVNEYKSEVITLSHLRHRNIVQLIGWCHENNNDLLVVYKLMPKGSLDTHLYCDNPVLSWSCRYKIAVDLAYALAYIHEDFDRDHFVLHKDIKPSNIMVDENFHAKLGDFGLARLVNHGQSAQTTRMAGTIGYMDPHSRGDVKSDMYSFGVVLLEMGSGLPLSKEIDGYWIHISDFALTEYRNGGAIGLADPRLQGTFLEEQLNAVILVGLWCVRPDPTMRLSAKEAIKALELVISLEDIPMDIPANMYGSSVAGSSIFVNSSGESLGSSDGTIPPVFAGSSLADTPDLNSDLSLFSDTCGASSESSDGYGTLSLYDTLDYYYHADDVGSLFFSNYWESVSLPCLSHLVDHCKLAATCVTPRPWCFLFCFFLCNIFFIFVTKMLAKLEH